jgi:NAD(P)-dependent dehydrogenase (short-subunit alcohol dehydrogenase family)
MFELTRFKHFLGKIELDNLNSEKYFKSSRIYGDTKLANLLFTFELNRKLRGEGYTNVIVNAVHPGPVHTNLFRNIPYYGWIIKLFIGLLYYTPEVS